jgi:phosphoribosylformylglycinamidine synthase
MKSAVITFPGSNCDRDAITALEKVGSKVERVWYKDSELPKNLDLIVVPGGFSYGDYLRSGAMAAISPIMQEVKKAGNQGVHVMGICNGFQILTEAGMLDGVLLRNKNIKFICKTVNLKVNNNQTKFTSLCKKDQILRIPIAHMDGNYFTDEKTLKNLEDNDQIAFRYCDENGNVNDQSNPNGALANIAGIFNKEKNVLGMMPHPERAADKENGNVDGLFILNSLLKSL